MGLFMTKEEKVKARNEKIKKRDYSKEKKARYSGTNLQDIGQIPAGEEIVLSLIPEKEVLNISYKTINITLPYDRIKNFTYEVVTSDKTNSIVKNAQNYLENAELKPLGVDLLGAKKLVTGLAGHVAGSLIPSNLNVATISSLIYIDKNGEQKELKFSNSEETGYAINTEERLKTYIDSDAISFSEVITMVKSRQNENMTEL